MSIQSMSDGPNYKELYYQEHDRICDLSGLIEALGVIADDLGGTPIGNPELAARRNAICAIARAMERLVDIPRDGRVDKPQSQ